jgi:GNAT superfamily N-acetyltransferase
MSITVLDRARLMLRRDGALGVMRRVAKRAWSYAVLFEDHVWFVLDTDAERPRPSLAPGLRLTRPTSVDLSLLEQSRSVVPRQARARLDAGNDLWLVLEGDRLLFSAWIFRGQTPTIAVPSGQLLLPSDTVCLEDSEAAPAARGRGIAPAAWAAIADAVAAEGKRWIITKVAVENTSSRRAVEKAGFEAVALMHVRRRGPRSRTSLEQIEGPRASFFAERVGPGLTAGPASR